MNLAAHAENKRAIAAAGALAHLVALLAQGGGAAEQAAGALMNLASNNALNQASIVKAEALSPLVALLQTAACARMDQLPRGERLHGRRRRNCNWRGRRWASFKTLRVKGAPWGGLALSRPVLGARAEQSGAGGTR